MPRSPFRERSPPPGIATSQALPWRASFLVILAQRPVRSFEQVSEESHAREQNLAALVATTGRSRPSSRLGDNQAFGILQGDDSRVTRYRRKLLKKLVERVTCATQKFHPA